MTDYEWKDFKFRVWARQKRERMILRDIKDCVEVAAGVGVALLLCGFCWLAG